MPMGCSSSCKTFETFSTAIEWIAGQKLEIDDLLHLLDDFLFVSPTYNQCKYNLERFISLCHQIGLPIVPDKTFRPCTTLTFAGIELDSIQSEARLPQEKITKCVELITAFLTRKKVQLHELQSLIGLLNFTTIYTRAWKLFDQFHSTLFQTANFGLPIMPANLTLFITFYLAHSTVNTYISALSYSHKLLGLPDPTRVFYIIQMLKGYGKTGSQLDSCLPITLPILQSLLEVAPRRTGSYYQICQFMPMCSLAFFAFLRMGEITTSKNKSCQPLQLQQLAYVCDSGNPVAAMKLTFHDFKHHYNQRPFTLTINRQQICCPIKLLLDYLALRGRQVGAIFLTQTGAPVTRDAFTSQLSEAIRLCGLDPSRYKGHSFQIGAASHAAEQGMSDSQIRIVGRWKSNTFQKYIRVQTMSA